MLRCELLKDLDEFKRRYVKNRIKDNLYNKDSNGNIIVKGFKSDTDGYNHFFIIVEKDVSNFRVDNSIISRNISKKIIENKIYSSGESIKFDSGDIIEFFEFNKSNKNKLNRGFTILNELISFLALDEKFMGYKNNKHLSLIYGICEKELETIKNIYFYDTSIVPYEKVRLLESKFDYDDAYFDDTDFEFDGFNPKNNTNLQKYSEMIRLRQNKSKIKAKEIYTK